MNPFPPSISDPGRRHAHSGSGQSELYFAYGSNMSVDQMSKRCPKSVFVGVARLDGFRWQINQRGVANIVPAGLVAEPMQPPHTSAHSPSYVEGLVYSVTPPDVQSLDRSEGVSLRLYEKEYMPLEIHEIDDYSGQLCTQLAPNLARKLAGAPRDASDSGSRGPWHKLGRKHTVAPTAYRKEALVYISGNYTSEGIIREEYITRMKVAIKCGVALGMSQSFVDKAIMPYLFESSSHTTRGNVINMHVMEPHRNRGASDRPVRRTLHNEDEVFPAVGVDEMHIDEPEQPVAERARDTINIKYTRNAGDAGNEQERPAVPVPSMTACGDPECSHDSPICDLRQENRRPHDLSGTIYDDAIFARLIDVKEHANEDPASTTCNIDTATPGKIVMTRLKSNVKLIFVVVLEEPVAAPPSDHTFGVLHPGPSPSPMSISSSRYSVEATTKTMAVAAELALKYFRDSLARFRVPVDGGGIIGPPVMDEFAAISQVSTAPDETEKCICFIGDNRLHFSVQLSRERGGGFIKAWVTQTELLNWE